MLVTGATGFIGAHVVDNLLARGLRVRAVARSKAKADRMLESRSQYNSQLDFFFIDDLATPGVFDDALRNVEGVIHVASVWQLSFTSCPSEELTSIPAAS